MENKKIHKSNISNNSKLKYKNYIFDFGDVLVDFDPVGACLKYTKNINLAKEITLTIFRSAEFAYFEAGVITVKDAWNDFSKKFNNKKTVEIAKKVFFNWYKYAIHQREGMLDVLKDLKNRGAKLYILSNINELVLKSERKLIPGYDFFDGIFYSFTSGYFKPQKDIYLSFLKRYKLKAKDCFFIDDRKWNIEGANKVGIDGYVYNDFDIKKLRKVLGI